jgi:hypothetical protein
MSNRVQTLAEYRENVQSKLAANLFDKFSRMSYIGTQRPLMSSVDL